MKAISISRIWNMDTMMPANTLYRRNIYSEELLKTLYIDPGLGFIKEQDTSAAAGEKVFYLLSVIISKPGDDTSGVDSLCFVFMPCFC